ncbi:MAG: amidohydrolase family protein [Spirochaetes bacterium]|nr:amidohydrolase family protein [Spirochaetota bacterium]
MIVNAHVHFGLLWGPLENWPVGYTADELLRDMDRDGIDKAVIIPFIQNYDNEFMAKSAKEHPDRLIAFAMINPWRHINRKDDIKRYADLGIKGIKLKSPWEGYNLNDDMILGDVYEACVEHGMPVLVHTGDDVACTPLQCEEVVRTYTEITLIMAHAGFRNLADEAVRVAKRNKRIILDLTAATSQQLRDALREIEPERIVFGSDSPFMDERVELEKFSVVIDDEHAKKCIMGETILRILKMHV